MRERNMRKSGVLLPITSIPSKYGIGTFSKSAYSFVDFLQESGQKLWQILPLGPTGFGDSPYQLYSTFAGNPYNIDLDEFIEYGWLTKEECDSYDVGKSDKVEYEKIYNSRFKLLKTAFLNSKIEQDKKYQEFIIENESWLTDYSLFMALKDYFKGHSWQEWDEPIKVRKKNAIIKYQKELKNEISFYCFQQYFFKKQWNKLKAYANKKGIEIVGDIPIYVALDSADAWSNPSLFQFDENLKPTLVAGCPPDLFSETGQLWGNPLYNWEEHKKQDYLWWVNRIAYCFDLYDIVRIDHFRGFDEYYAIPYADITAEYGEWKQGPGYELFAVLKKRIGNKPIIAEDLGYLTPSVYKLLKKCKYPGMKILQFAFDAKGDSEYLPHNAVQNSVMYTGTHDNDTIIGWYDSLSKADQRFAKKYAQVRKKEEVHWDFIRLALGSSSNIAIIPFQDYLGHGSKARINIPSTLGNNWEWRFMEGVCTKELAKKMKELVELYRRI